MDEQAARLRWEAVPERPRRHGRVVYVKPDKSFGFVQDSGGDVFFTFSQFHGYPATGAHVTFELEEFQGRRRARDVRPV